MTGDFKSDRIVNTINYAKTQRYEAGVHTAQNQNALFIYRFCLVIAGVLVREDSKHHAARLL